MTSRTLAACVAWAAPIFMGVWACSASSSPDPLGSNSGPNNGTGSAGAGSKSATGSGSASNGGGGSAGSNGGGFNVGTGATGNNADAGCYTTSSAAEQVTMTITRDITTTEHTPVDMLIMYDQSGSMNDDTPAGSKWDAIKAALIGFVQSPESADIGVGISYFPLSPPDCSNGGPGCQCINIIITQFCWANGGGSCNATEYAPPDVPIGLLPGVAQQIEDSVNAHGPSGGTPTAPALAGAHQYAATWAAAHPDRKTIVVLATDGEPTGCSNNSVQDVANIAAAGLAGMPSVMTFVIGVGSSLTSLNAIAAAGGSGQALIVDAASGDPTQQFLDAMNKIRETVTVVETVTETVTETTPVACEWLIPEPTDGQEFDKNKVNVDFVAGQNPPQRIGAVSSAADCANVSGGWHYDNPDSPTKVLVCPQTCSTIQGISDARVDVVFGCATEIAIR